MARLFSNFRVLAFTLGIFGCFSIVWRWIIPPYSIFLAGNDDYLLVNQAWSILNGEWLGTWGNLTLAKPAGYAVFAVASWVVNLPPPVLAQVLYVGGAYLVAISLAKLRFGNFYSFLVFVVMVFNPALYGMSGSRIYRDSLLSAQMALLLGFLLLATVAIFRLPPKVMWSRGLVFASAGTGFVVGWTYVTKRDVAVLEVIVIICLIFFVLVQSTMRKRVGIRAFAMGSLILILGFCFPIISISAMNWRYYGYFGTEDFYSGGMSHVWQDWARVNGGSTREWVPIDKSQRVAVYSVSPMARRIQPYLEGAPGTGWRSQPCNKAVFCDESGPWFIWDLRDAFAVQGLAHTEMEFQRNLKVLAYEIEDACARGTLTCSRWPAPVGLPTLNKVRFSDVLADARLAMDTSRSFISADPSPGFFDKPPQEVATRWSQVVRGTEIGSSPFGWDWRLRFGIWSGHSLREVGSTLVGLFGLPILLITLLHGIFGVRRRFFSLIAIAILLGLGASYLMLGFIAAGAFVEYATAAGYSLPGSVLLVAGLAIGGANVIAIILRRLRN